MAEDASHRFDHIDRVLDDGSSRPRVVAGRSGVVAGFAKGPALHVSWWAVALGLVAWLALRRRHR